MLCPGRLGYRLGLRHHRRSVGEFSREHVHARTHVKGDGKRDKRTSITSQGELAGGQHVPAVVVPHGLRAATDQPRASAAPLPSRYHLPRKALYRLPEGRRPPRLVAFARSAGPWRQAVGRVLAAGPGGERRGPHRPRPPPASRHHEPGCQRTSRAGQRVPDRSRAPAARRAARVAGPTPTAAGVRHRRGWMRTRSDRAAGPPGRARTSIRRPGLRGSQQSQGRVQRPGLVLGLRRGQRPLRPAARVEGQCGRALQEGGPAASPPRAWARPAERSSSLATSSSGPSVAWARCQARRSGGRPADPSTPASA